MLYSMVVANGVIVGLLGLAALSIVRVERRSSQRLQEIESAQALAWAGVELGVHQLAHNSGWRESHVHNVETASRTFAGGSVTWRFLDITDTDLADDKADAVELQGIGRFGDAVWVQAQRFQFPKISPLDHALHSHGQITIDLGTQLTSTTASISTNGTLNLLGTLAGSAECQSKFGTGAVTGTVEEGAPTKSLPAASVFSTYALLATALPLNGDIYRDVLAPGLNTYAGGLNANGVYYINTGGAEIDIRGSRLHGTLIIDGHCQIDDQALLEPFRSDYPTLIVSGNLRVTTYSQSQSLSENNYSMNYNSTGAPYSGVTDSDQSDLYPNEVRGLVHVKGNFTMDNTARIRGIVICEGQAVITGGNNELIHDPAIAAAPPSGYNIADYILAVQPQTARRAAAP